MKKYDITFRIEGECVVDTPAMTPPADVIKNSIEVVLWEEMRIKADITVSDIEKKEVAVKNE